MQKKFEEICRGNGSLKYFLFEDTFDATLKIFSFFLAITKFVSLGTFLKLDCKYRMVDLNLKLLEMWIGFFAIGGVVARDTCSWHLGVLGLLGTQRQ